METGTRQLILDTATKLFSQRGYENISVQDICTACGISKGGLYHHFPGKIEIFQGILDTTGRDYVSRMKDAAKYDGDFPKTLADIFRATVSFEKENPHFFSIYYSLSSNLIRTETFEHFMKFRDQVNNVFDTLFMEATDIFGNMKGFQGLYSQLFQSAINYSVFRSKIESKEIEPQDLDKIIHAFLWGVAN